MNGDVGVHHAKIVETSSLSNTESLEVFEMYYAIGVSAPSLHRESTDSLIYRPKNNLLYLTHILIV